MADLRDLMHGDTVYVGMHGEREPCIYVRPVDAEAMLKRIAELEAENERLRAENALQAIALGRTGDGNDWVGAMEKMQAEIERLRAENAKMASYLSGLIESGAPQKEQTNG